MSFMKRNPTLVQQGPHYGDRAPVFLIHDGGGTTFAYHCLGSLGRRVYAIHNPLFSSRRQWKGGIPRMAQAYADLIRTVCHSGPILLGGWSMGGLISMEVASVLAADPNIVVLGLVLIDSVYPLLTPTESRNAVSTGPVFDKHVRPEVRSAVQRCLTAGRALVEAWNPPCWQEPDQLTDDDDDSDSPERSGLMPPAIMLRAAQYAPTPGDSPNPESRARVDIHRELPKLGWEQDPCERVVEVLEVPGHHYSIFDSNNIPTITRRLAYACDVLDRKT